jgi:hypothetical protein
MLSMLHAQDTLFRMKEIRRCDIHGIDQRAFCHLFQRGKSIRYLMFGGKGIRRLLLTGINSNQFKTVILPRSGNHPVGYKVGSDYSKTYFSTMFFHIFHSLSA